MSNQTHRSKITVAVDALPQLMSDLLMPELAQASDIEVITELSGPSTQQVDVLLTTGSKSTSRTTLLPRLIERPRTVVLILTEGGDTLNRAFLKVDYDTLDQPSIGDIVAAIRHIASRNSKDLLPLESLKESVS